MKENVQPAVPISSNQVSSSANVAALTGMPSSMYSMATKQNLSAPFQIFNSGVFGRFPFTKNFGKFLSGISV